MRKAIENNAKLLALFAVACTTLVGLVHLLTKDIIVEQEQQQLLNTLNELVDPSTYNNAINQACIMVEHELLGIKTQKAYLAKKGHQPIAAAITTTAPDGYNGDIQLMVAISFDGVVKGVRTLKHKETPGLGDKIELRKSPWILSFNNKQILDNKDRRWAVAKDGGMFDQFTGATITPRAVVNAVKRTVTYFNQNKKQLFDKTANCQEVL